VLRLVADVQVLRSAVLFGSQNLVLYSTLTWLPFRVSAGGTGHVTLTLFAFSVPGLLPSTALAATRIRYATSRGFYAIAALAPLASSAALLLLKPDWLPIPVPAAEEVARVDYQPAQAHLRSPSPRRRDGQRGESHRQLRCVGE
jgi:hypothetical protein